MSDIHQRLEAFWAGERPDQIPYTIYHNEWRHAQDDPAWEPMFREGLGVTYHVSPCREETPGLEVLWDEYEEDGQRVSRQRMRTPVGELSQTWIQGWHHTLLLKTAEDYRVMTWIARNTQVHPAIEECRQRIESLPPFGVPLLSIGRTPLQTILVDLAGIEAFSVHLVDLEAEVRELYEALLVRFRRRVEIAAQAPGRFVSNLENFTAESLGPRRYAQFLLPVYEECFPLLHEAGKIVGSHYDGRTASCRDLIARAPIDLIESLTEPYEGDQTLEEARRAWPDKLFWVNVRVGDYQLPPAQLREKALDMVRRGSPDGRRLAFEVSEQIPGNWKDSMPVVLEALRETRAG